MTKLTDIPLSSEELLEDSEDEVSKQIALARKLERDGHKTIAVGRAIAVIERINASDADLPTSDCDEVLRIAFYSDPDVSGEEQPMCLYLKGSRWGFAGAFLETLNSDGRLKLFKLEEVSV